MSLQLKTFCDLLYGSEPEDSYIEMRAIARGRPPVQDFFGVREIGPLGSIRTCSAFANVYLGVAPRCRQEGTRDTVRRCHALFVDLDTPEAVEALLHFAPEPSMVVDSGRQGHRHAYWACLRISDQLEAANKRLAHHLGGDMAATDAARVLRPPGSINRKRGGGVVTIVETSLEVYEVDYVVGDLDPPVEQPRRAGPTTPRTNGNDPLLEIPPVIYVEELLGVKVGRGGKVSCPFPGHRNGDRTASLHVFDDPSAGWFCFGCRRGGSVYDLAAELAGVEPRGTEFLALADYLRERFL